MLLFLETVNIIAITLMLFILAVILKQQPSRAQTAFILYNVFTMVFVVGIHLELLHANTVGEALAGLCIQYVGQAGLLMSLLWFVSEFVKFSIPAWVYILEAVCDAFVLTGIFTAEKHHFFYSYMKIRTDGLYNRIEVGHGILWHFHYIILFAIVFIILFLCAVRYKKSTPIQKKRILYIAIGIGTLAGTLVLKTSGLFGSYNPIVIAMTFSMFCMMMAIVRYSYFGSLHAAVDNAFNHGNEGLVILDSDNIIVFVNNRMDELFPDIRKGAAISSCQEIWKLIEKEDSAHLLQRNGIFYEMRIEDIIEHGEKNGCMLWFVDQTQTFSVMQKLKEADEAKTQFLMRVSHELRTPMNTMLGMNEMVIRESSEEEIKNYAGEVASAGAHMMLLIDEVLNASRLESGTLIIEKSPYQISEVIASAEKLMRPQAEEKGLVFTTETEHSLIDENMFQTGDPARILLILANLLSNAIKYTDSGFVSLKAETQTEADGRKLILSVSDSGIGIQEDEQKQIFENFGRGSNTGGRDGMGLGLAIVKKLAEAMGGVVTVKSTPENGSVFTVSLALEEASEEEVNAWRKKEQKNKKHAAHKKITEWPDLHTKTILVADDNNNNIMVLKHLLKRTKAMIETATDGSAAIEACKCKKYDLVLLDHMMPGMDGITTFHKIRQDKTGKNQDTKIIALTANAGNGAEQIYLSEGFAGYIAKPVDPCKLEQLLIQCLSSGNEADMPSRTRWSDKLKQNGINTQEGLRYADMDMVFYHELLDLFARQYEKQQQKLDHIRQDIIKQKDVPAAESTVLWNEWTVSCHGLKGEAKGLGALALSGYFDQLELAGKTRNKEKIEKIYPEVIEEWQKIVDEIKYSINCQAI